MASNEAGMKEKGEKTLGKMSSILIKLYFSLGESDISAIRTWTYQESRWLTAFCLCPQHISCGTKRYQKSSLLHYYKQDHHYYFLITNVVTLLSL